jgi:hypothetical protein
MKTGLYRHYKGQLYNVTGTVRHSETMEILALYQCLYGDFSVWVRPVAMFDDLVEYDGKTMKRFTYIGEVQKFIQ